MQTLSSSPNFQEQPNRFSRNNAIAFSISICLIFCIAPVNSIRADVNKNQSNFQDLTKTIQAGEWLELPGNISEVFVDKEKTQGEGYISGPSSVIKAWNGAAWSDNCGYFLGGGHADYGGNEVYSYCWEGKRPLRWEVLMPPSKTDPDDHSQCPHPKEGPRAYHTYDGILYVPATKSIFIWGTVGFCMGHYAPNDEVPELILEPKPKWILHPMGPLKGFTHSAYNNKNGKVYIWEGSRQAYIVDPKTLTYKTSGVGTADYGASANMIYDIGRDVLWANTNHGLFQFVLDHQGEVSAIKKIVERDQFPAGLSGADGLDLRKGKLYFWSGNNSVITYDPDTNKWNTYIQKNGPIRSSGNGIFSKWHYIKKQDVFLGVSNQKQGMWVWKPAEGEGQLDTRQIKQCKAGTKVCTDHKTVDAALKDINPGSTLIFSSGYYYNDGAIVTEKNLKLSGNPEVLIQGVVAGKATFVTAGDDLKFENFDITLPVGAAQSNEACFRGEGTNLNLKKIYCHHMQMGIMGGPGSLTIEQSRFEDSGLNANAELGHMVYACSNSKCPGGSLIIRDSKFTRMGVNRPGHAIKSRSPKNLIENVVISGLDAHSGRAIDIPQGGDTIIRNSVMQIGANGDNEDFIAIGLESKNFPLHENTKTLIENVIAICDLKEPCDFVRYLGPEPILKNVVLIGQFRFYDDLYPISRDGIKIYRDRAEAGLKPYPYVPEKWVQIKPH